MHHQMSRALTIICACPFNFKLLMLRVGLYLGVESILHISCCLRYCKLRAWLRHDIKIAWTLSFQTFFSFASFQISRLCRSKAEGTVCVNTFSNFTNVFIRTKEATSMAFDVLFFMSCECNVRNERPIVYLCAPLDLLLFLNRIWEMKKFVYTYYKNMKLYNK